MKTLACALATMMAQGALADVLPFTYRLGAVSLTESEYTIVINAKTPVTVAILPGGRSWPILSLDQAGDIYAGNTIIDAATGRGSTDAQALLVLPFDVQVNIAPKGIAFRHAGKQCVLSPQQLGLSKERAPLAAIEQRNIAFTSTADGLLALVTQFAAGGNASTYLSEKIDIGRCRITDRRQLGNPDLLIELGSSKRGGWWITGSIEQTLLQSSDGRNWRKAKLPKGLSSLVSAYVVDPQEIWLAGILHAEHESPYLLAVSTDGGRTWRNLMANDPMLPRVPAGWLEGQKRVLGSAATQPVDPKD